MKVVALIDGEHYPPVVRDALERLAADHDIAAAVFCGGTEKVGRADAPNAYGVPVVRGATAADSLRSALDEHAPEAVVDLSDEPVLSASDRFALASIALGCGASYLGADFRFDPPRALVRPATPVLGIIGTGKRVGKTAVSAYVARHLKAAGTDVVVVAMGRGGPATPEIIHAERVPLTTADLLEVVRLGGHAASDNYEDAVMSRVATVGCRRCGGGLAGATSFSNVEEGARLADALGKDLLIAEGSGSAIPPIAADANILVIGAGQGAEYVSGYFGPYRLGLADLVVVANAEDLSDRDRVLAEVRRVRPGLPVVPTVFRPTPVEPVAGARVFYATTAPPRVLPRIVAHLEAEHGCLVAGASAHLSDRNALGEDLARAAGTFDLLLTELKAAAVDVVAMAGEAAGVPTVFCDNVPEAVGGQALGEMIESVARSARDRAAGRSGAEGSGGRG